MRAGEAFGEKSALCRTPRSASCVAVHETVLVSIDRLGFHTTLASEYMASLQKKLDCFKVHQLEVHTRFNNLFYERSFPAGAYLLRDDEPIAELTLILSGSVELTAPGRAGRRLQLGDVCAGGVVGDECVVPGRPLTAPSTFGARVTEAVEVITIRADDLLRLPARTLEHFLPTALRRHQMRCARLAQARGRDGVVRAAAGRRTAPTLRRTGQEGRPDLHAANHRPTGGERARQRAARARHDGGTRKRHAAALARLGAERAAQSFDRPPPPLSERPTHGGIAVGGGARPLRRPRSAHRRPLGRAPPPPTAASSAAARTRRPGRGPCASASARWATCTLRRRTRRGGPCSA